MTTAIDAKIAAGVAKMFAKLGGGVAATITEPKAYDAATGGGTGSATTHSVKVTPLAYYKANLIDGDLIRAGDAVVYLSGAGLGFTPKAGWKIAVAGTTFNIVAVTSMSGGDDVGAYELQVRR